MMLKNGYYFQRVVNFIAQNAVDLEIINTVLRKFLTSPRHPNYLNKPEYAHLKEIVEGISYKNAKEYFEF